MSAREVLRNMREVFPHFGIRNANDSRTLPLYTKKLLKL